MATLNRIYPKKENARSFFILIFFFNFLKFSSNSFVYVSTSITSLFLAYSKYFISFFKFYCSSNVPCFPLMFFTHSFCLNNCSYNVSTLCCLLCRMLPAAISTSQICLWTTKLYSNGFSTKHSFISWKISFNSCIAVK